MRLCKSGKYKSAKRQYQIQERWVKFDIVLLGVGWFGPSWDWYWLDWYYWGLNKTMMVTD